MNEIKTILCMDDDSDNCELLQFLLSGEGFEVVMSDNVEDAIGHIKTGSISAVILDNMMSRTSGVEITREIRKLNDQIPIIFYSGAVFPSDIKTALDSGAQAYLKKPLDFMIIPETVRQFVFPIPAVNPV